MSFIGVAAALGTMILAPFMAGKAMGLRGGIGKGALAALVILGLINVIGMIAQFAGPLGGVLGVMAAIAAWYQVVKVVYGTDTAATIVFMFWHVFFHLLMTSLLWMIIDGEAAMWFLSGWL